MFSARSHRAILAAACFGFAAFLAFGPAWADGALHPADPTGTPEQGLPGGAPKAARTLAAVQITALPALSTQPLVADGSTEYTITMTALDGDGSDDIQDMRVLFNYQEGGWDQQNARGYMVWAATDSLITRYGGTWTIADATGSGRWGYRTDAWGGDQYIAPLGCAVTVGGLPAGGEGTRTAAWTFSVKPAWASNPLTNDADGWVADAAANTGWRDNPAEFDVLAAACPGAPPAPRAPLVASPSSTSLDVAIDPADPAASLYAIRIAPHMNGKRFVQADGAIGSFPVFQSRTDWGTKRVSGLLWGRTYGFSARSLDPATGDCASAYGPEATGTTLTSRVVPRANYGARFEPLDKIIHGAGQTYSQGSPQNLGFDYYAELLGPLRYPLTFMAYCGITTGQAWYDMTRNRLDGYRTNDGRYVVPQIGFYIAAGEATPTQAQIDALVGKIRSLGRPVFLRMGYEFNGTWYDPMYNAPYYVQSFQMVIQRLRDAELPVATLWCAYPAFSPYYGNWEYLDDFYPGDEYVDWWSIDLFLPGDLTHSNSLAFLAKADAAGKPVMIGEATPTTVGADDASDWDTWFAPFFDLIHNYRCIKGHTYINYDWAGTSWPDWGDSRLETGDPSVRSQYLDEMSNPIYLHAPDEVPDFFLPVTSAAREDADLNRYE